MADSRILHRRAGSGAKVTALSHLEFRVWAQYLLSSDDYGVMPAHAHVLQGANACLRREPTKRIQTALETLVAVGLIATFMHQGDRFVWQPDWQTFQQVRHPRNTVNPTPPPQELSKADEVTLKLFRDFRAELQDSSGNFPEKVPSLARAHGRETLTPTQPPTQTLPVEEGGAGETTAIAPVWNPNGRSRHNRSLVGNHTGCYPSPACGRGMCVPGWLGAQWARQFDDPADAERHIGAFIDATLTALDPGPVGDEPKKFWPAAWERHHGTRRPSSTSGQSRTADTIEAGRRSMAKRGLL